MARINLLPWREERREQRRKEFITLSVATALFGVVLSGLIWMFFNNQLSAQNEANASVVAANQQLDQQLKSLDGLQARRDEIVERMKLIQDLQGVRPVVVHVFDEVTKLTPNNMYLTSFAREGDKFSFTGKAQDPNVVSDFLRNLGGSPWFRNAFMNSFVAAEVKPQQQGGVLPRPEDNYGTFLVTVDLGDVHAIQAAPVQPAAQVTSIATPASTSSVTTVNPTQSAEASSSANVAQVAASQPNSDQKKVTP